MQAAERGSAATTVSVDRARVYRTLARLFCLPDADALDLLRRRELPELREALGRLGADGSVAIAAEEVAALLAEADLERLQRGYHATFEASGGLRCPPNETSHTADTAQQALTRTFELADVAGFYRAFGVEVEPGTERPDHISAELEFMHLLAVKEAVAREGDGASEQAEICREAARAFLRDHLWRWAPRLAESLEQAAADPLYAAAGRLLGRFVELDATSLGAS